ncbi:MAG: hypothetical protein ACRCXB_18750 [Aeromonadaceae bacterium]
MKTELIAVSAYALVAILTFGYSYNADYQQPGENSIVSSGELNGARALLCGAMWPAYWAVSAFEWARPVAHQQ